MAKEKITIRFWIELEAGYYYCVIVNKEDKVLATDLVNKAYNEYLQNDNITDFQGHAEALLRENGIEHAFSIWNE